MFKGDLRKQTVKLLSLINFSGQISIQLAKMELGKDNLILWKGFYIGC